MQDNQDNQDHKENAEEIVETTASNTTTTPIDDNDGDVATAEEMAAESRRSAEKRAHNKQTKKESDEDHVEFTEYNPENQIDPYLEPDPSIPWVKYDEPIFLSRGCNHCPESYVPVSSIEACSCSKVTSCNWMQGIRQPSEHPFDVVEVRFKNNRKDFYRLPDGIDVSEGDVVAVEGMPGHDVGIVSITGESCRIQMKKRHVDPSSENIKKLFRRAKASDIERWAETLQEEKEALLRTRRITEDLGLVMKVNDVEFQGDRSKAIFYYTADDRVDFRALIKVLAEEFKVRVEMKQIGVRQEAGKVGGIGTCGRELCCSTWLTNFKSVTTNAAKTQQILPNPQKLAGQCGKLKCCLNFEYEVYADALKKFPPANTPIRFQKGLALYRKTDVFRGIMWYVYEGQNDLYAITAENVKKIIEMNRNQQYPEKLEDFQEELMSTSALQQEASNAEFERELQRLVDNGDGVVSEDNKGKHDNRRDNRDNRNSRGEHRNERRDKDNRRREPREGRREEPREERRNPHNSKRDNRNEPKEPREPRETREPREPKERRDDRQPRRNNHRDNRQREPRNNDNTSDK